MGMALVTCTLLVTVEEEQGNAVFAKYNLLYITNKTEHLILKVGMPCMLRSIQRQTGL